MQKIGSPGSGSSQHSLAHRVTELEVNGGGLTEIPNPLDVTSSTSGEDAVINLDTIGPDSATVNFKDVYRIGTIGGSGSFVLQYYESGPGQWTEILETNEVDKVLETPYAIETIGHISVDKDLSADDAVTVYTVGDQARAREGLIGDDDYSLEVSSDGVNWLEAFTVDRNTGVATFNQPIVITNPAVEDSSNPSTVFALQSETGETDPEDKSFYARTLHSEDSSIQNSASSFDTVFNLNNYNKHITFVGDENLSLDGEFSIGMWVHVTNLTSNNKILTYENAWRLTMVSDGHLRWYSNDNSVTFTSSTLALTENNWHHIAVGRDDTNTTYLWVDGVEVGSTSTVFDVTHVGTTTDQIILGSQNSDGLRGYVQDVIVTKGACLYDPLGFTPTQTLSTITDPSSGPIVTEVVIDKLHTSADNSFLIKSDGVSTSALGTFGSDDVELRVSSDGTTWLPAITVDNATGAVAFPNTDLSSVPAGGATGQVLAKSSATDGDVAWVDASGSEFGDSPPVNTDYINARGLDLTSNGTGLLGNNYNYPDDYVYDPVNTPNLPAAFSYAGYFPGLRSMEEFIAVDPNKVYRLSSYLQQEALSGDWSAYAGGERHRQYMGLLSYDIDGNIIVAQHHMRYRRSNVDSLTTLSAPLSPGDTQISVDDAGGWNQGETSSVFQKGVIIFGYRNSVGVEYENYSRIFSFDLFDSGGVNTTTKVITLNKPLPSAMGNPNDANGTWPVGTRVANTSSGYSYKFSFYNGLVPSASGEWYSTTNYMGGLDTSGRNVIHNFAPGTALVKVFWFPNYTNRTTVFPGYPDTGANHRVWYTGVSVIPDPYASLTVNADGSQAIKVPTADPSTGVLSLQPAALEVNSL